VDDENCAMYGKQLDLLYLRLAGVSIDQFTEIVEMISAAIDSPTRG
jgi:hypothetical protein